MTKFHLTAIILILSFLGLSIVQVSSLARQQALNQQYSAKLQDLRERQQSLQVRFNKAHSLQSLEQAVQKLGFKKVDQISYIEAAESWVAAGR